MLQDYFQGLTDKRQPWKIKHKLLEIVVMTICAVIAGCDAWEDIMDFCRVKECWFKQSLHMELANGIPSHDTMQRVWGMLDPNEFRQRFRAWVESVCGTKDGEIISIDGKTLRRSGDQDQNPLHMVSAWANQNQLVLGQLAVEEKSNEITAVPELLDVLDIKNSVITADAMSCQKEITKKIVGKGADYVIGLKGNQPNLLEDAWNDPRNYPELQATQTFAKGHGRIEQRRYYLTTKIDWLSCKKQWGGLRGLGAVCSKVSIGENVSEEIRYFITSLSDVNTFAKAARAHWGVENSLHWCLDMTFHEDYSRMRKDHSAENMAVVRHIALDILRQYPPKVSLARKRRRCAYDDAFLADVLHFVHA